MNKMVRLCCTLLMLAYALPATALDLAGFKMGREITMMDRAEMTRGEKGLCDETSCYGPKMLGDYPVMVTVQANSAGRIQYIL
ncbi:MAG: hypothetical protein WKH97_09950 [Casimicrobiaceae bacterium]